MTVSPKIIITAINEAIDDHCYYFAIGLIKETINLFKNHNNFELLSDESKQITLHYLGKEV